MGDAKLFRFAPGPVSELKPSSIAVEKSLQKLIEAHLETFLGVRFLASEFVTSKAHGGRIDTVGVDENGSPVIIEYKRSLNENVINQGLFYLDWLLDHKADFKFLVLERFDSQTANSVDWSAPRLLCIAGDFTRYDEHAVNQIGRNIELIRYRQYGEEYLLLELLNTPLGNTGAAIETSGLEVKIPSGSKKSIERTVSDKLAQSTTSLQDRFYALDSFAQALGDDVQRKELQNYIAYRRLKNFACVEVFPTLDRLTVYLKADFSRVELEEGFTRDVRNIGHYGTGDLEASIRSDHDLERAKPLILESYNIS
jgi:predicted transport protein